MSRSAQDSPDLTDDDRAMLDGRDGPAVAMAMRIVVALARTLQADRLIDISSAHIDSCLYHGRAGLDFANRLVELGGTVRVPTTLNVGSVDLLHPGLVRSDGPEGGDHVLQGRRLMDAYVALGCSQTWTCAPYQLPERPGFGTDVAWAESNAIVFANSVLGARTDRYGDFLDICAALTGRAPLSGLHLTENRRAEIILDCSAVDARLLAADVAYPLLGYLAGTMSGTKVPVFVGLPPDTGEDRLKSLGAAAASSGGVALFHAVGITPEAPTLDDAVQGRTPADSIVITTDLLAAARQQLSSVRSGRLDAVSIGTPHASLAECRSLAEGLAEGPAVHPDVTVYLSTGRFVLGELERTGLLAVLRAANVQIVADTCTYVTTILAPSVRIVMTTSAKWAHYAPTNLGVDVVLGSLDECLTSARAGQIVLGELVPQQGES